MGDSAFAEVRGSGSLPFHGIPYLRTSEPHTGRTGRRELGEGMHALDLLCPGRTEPPLCMVHWRGLITWPHPTSKGATEENLDAAKRKGQWMLVSN